MPGHPPSPGISKDFLVIESAINNVVGDLAAIQVGGLHAAIYGNKHLSSVRLLMLSCMEEFGEMAVMGWMETERTLAQIQDFPVGCVASRRLMVTGTFLEMCVHGRIYSFVSGFDLWIILRLKCIYAGQWDQNQQPSLISNCCNAVLVQPTKCRTASRRLFKLLCYSDSQGTLEMVKIRKDLQGGNVDVVEAWWRGS
ncbi:hypothetical protein Nepgr_008541 [Nepenthes gracilis]|uniref:Uncharacterized protein n=1 Tax=Nepenthes gracilis TaxID=150966 RepID=A0AAD3S986_NEPGR|nr:hypothetical protein Nepgr_008541 [Nepenthes gracilis]